jgi:molybdopterin-containing oxidoreductase family membrane subunit
MEDNTVESSHFRTTRGWLIGISISGLLVLSLLTGITILLIDGVGIWGINRPVYWAFAITNFVWWIGIGHAGTFISAILFLVRQHLRTEISRLAETMTIFAVLCAGLFPLVHLGRPWFFYWLFPYYDTMDLWPQFRSPLVWDVFAVSTYLIVSLCFWYLGLVPDLAIYRDNCRTQKAKVFYGALALGWRGSSDQWRAYRSCYILLAGFAAPLVISVHSIVGMDFAASIVSGWHSTIFPPYFVAGAIFSGFAMVITIAVPLRRMLHLEQILTLRHFDLCAKFLLTTGVIVAYGYGIEAFTAYVSDNPRDISMIVDHYVGAYAPLYWLMIFCNVVAPQILWLKKVRRSLWTLFGLSLIINIGMWLERFNIVVGSLYHADLPASIHIFVPTRWDLIFLFGSMGLFAFLYLLYGRFFPLVAISEMRKDKEEGK